MKQVTVYSKPNCMQCNFTKKWLDDNKIEFKEVNVMDEPQTLMVIKSWGFQSLPVVEIEGQEPFFGFQPDRLESVDWGE